MQLDEIMSFCINVDSNDPPNQKQFKHIDNERYLLKKKWAFTSDFHDEAYTMIIFYYSTISVQHNWILSMIQTKIKRIKRK